ncbi:MAG: hypothetical protein R3294_06615, partial [Arenibacter troitsensis]|nr:hypothetical protein [Arenibacter troitsensis]
GHKNIDRTQSPRNCGPNIKRIPELSNKLSQEHAFTGVTKLTQEFRFKTRDHILLFAVRSSNTFQ